MGFLHFVNCVLLAFMPLLVIDQCFRTMSWPSFRLTAGVFMTCQLVKMITAATLSPSHSGSFSVVQELLGLVWGTGGSLTLCDCAALLQLFANARTLRQDYSKPAFLIVAFGWSLCDSLTSRVMPLWVNARVGEFTWDWILFALEANVELLKTLCVCFILSIFASRKGFPSSSSRQLSTLLLFALLSLRTVDSALQTAAVGNATRVLTGGTLACVLGLLTKISLQRLVV